MSISPVVIKGSRFFKQSSGEQFFLKGVEYASIASSDVDNDADILSSAAACARDIPILQELQTNVVSVFGLDANNDHSRCFASFAEANIYILPIFLQNSTVWDVEAFSNFQLLINEIQAYDNLLGIMLSGDGGMNASEAMMELPYVSASIRDIRTYIRQSQYRQIPIGYTTINYFSLQETYDYLQCTETDARIDFFGVQDFSWCNGEKESQTSYPELLSNFSSSSIPVFTSQYGCIDGDHSTRNWSATPALYSSKFTSIWSGGIAYEYFNDSSGFGLVSIHQGSVSPGADFTALSSRLATVSPTGPLASDYTPTAASMPICTSLVAIPSPLPPTPNMDACNCMLASLDCQTTIPSFEAVNASFLVSTLSQTNFSTTDQFPLFQGIETHPDKGIYDPWSMCNATEVISWVLNQNYLLNNKDPQSCSASGSGTLLAPSAPTGTCRQYLSQASSGTGTITLTPTFTPVGASANTTNTAAGLTTALGLTPLQNAQNNSTPGSTSDTSSDSQSHALTPGAIAGIVVGVIVALVLWSIALVFLLRRRRQRRRRNNAASNSNGMEKPELPANHADRKDAAHLLDGTQTSELAAGRRVGELAADRGIGELAGDRGPGELAGDYRGYYGKPPRAAEMPVHPIELPID